MGIISTKTHTVIGLVVGALLIFAPAIFNITNDAAAMVPLWFGIFIIANELITTSPYSPLKLVPMKVHIVVDVVTGLFLALSPWIFGFADTNQASEWVPHVIVGVMVMGYALLTTTADSRESVVTE